MRSAGATRGAGSRYDRFEAPKRMSFLAVVLSVPVLVAALALPGASGARPPAMDHHRLVWRSGPVRRERLQWWAVVAVGVAVAATVLALYASHAAAIEAAHGAGPHAHFALSGDGILTATPATGWPWALLPPWGWLLPIPVAAVAAFAVPLIALRARWQLTGCRERLSVRRCWPWRTRELRWSEVTEVYGAGATLHVDTRRGPVALRADGAELDVTTVAAWLAAARVQATDDDAATRAHVGTAPPVALHALRARAARGGRD